MSVRDAYDGIGGPCAFLPLAAIPAAHVGGCSGGDGVGGGVQSRNGVEEINVYDARHENLDVRSSTRASLSEQKAGSAGLSPDLDS